jgi:hypothetical protein
MLYTYILKILSSASAYISLENVSRLLRHDIPACALYPLLHPPPPTVLISLIPHSRLLPTATRSYSFTGPRTSMPIHPPAYERWLSQNQILLRSSKFASCQLPPDGASGGRRRHEPGDSIVYRDRDRGLPLVPHPCEKQWRRRGGEDERRRKVSG